MRRGTRSRRRRGSRARSTTCSPATISRSTAIAITARRRASSATRGSRSPHRPTRRSSSSPMRCISPRRRIRSASRARSGRPIRGRPIRRRCSSTRARRSTRSRRARRSSSGCPTDADMRVTGYGGTRAVRQFLALSGVGATSSGGVTDLDGSSAASTARLIDAFRPRRPPRLDHARRELRIAARSSGAATSTTTGMLGDLRRDETDNVSNTDGYLQFEYALADRACRSSPAGATATSASNPTTTTSRRAIPTTAATAHYSHGSPVVGAHVACDRPPQRLRELRAGVRDADVHRARLSHRSAPGSISRCSPSVSNSGEIGLKALIGRDQRVNLAAFDIKTTDEIVIDTAIGGRTTYKNADARRERKGVEAAWQGDLGAGFAGLRVVHVPVRQVHRRGDDRRSAADRARRARGCPGVPGTSAYGELSWSYPQAGGPQRRARGPVRGQDLCQRPQHRCRAGVDDREPARRLRADARARGCSASSRGSTTSRTSTTSAPSSSATPTAATSSRRRRAIS